MSTLDHIHITNNPQYVSTHPELNRIAVKQQIDAEYLLWCVLRAVEGSSHFTRKEAYQYSLKSGLSFTHRHWNRLIESGNGIFWGIDAKRIYFRSFDRVYKLLADDDCISVRNPQWITIEVNKSGLERRAELYWSWFLARDAIEISRASIENLFGLSPDQQRSYEKCLGSRLIIQTNYCHIDADLYKDNLTYIPKHAYSFIQERFTDNKIETITVIAYQMPNTFIARPKHSAVSAVAKAAKRALNAIARLYRHTLACGKEWRYLRLYFQFYDEWDKAGQPEYAFIRTYFQGKKHIYRIGHFL